MRLSPAFLSSIYPGYMHAQALQSQTDEQRARALLQARYAQPVSTGGVDLSQFFTDPGAATMGAMQGQQGGQQPGGLPQQVPGAGPPGGPPAPAPSTGFAGGAGAPSQGPGLPPQVAASPPSAPLPGAGVMGGPLAGGAARPPVMLAQTGGGMPPAAPPPGMGVPPQVAPSPMGAPPPAPGMGQPGMGQPGMGQPGMGQGQPRQFNAAAAFQALRRNPANAGVPDEALLQYVRQFQQTMTAGQITPYEQAELAQRNQISPYQQAELARSKQQDEEHKREFGITSGLESRRIKDAEQHQDVILMQDQGNNNHTYRYNIATGKSTEMDTQTPYAPSGASTKMGTSGQPRSAPAMAVKKFMEEHPDATADDIANFGAAYGAKVKTARDFATGQQGNGVKAIQTVLQHFDVVQQAADALGSTDIQVQNRARQFWQKQFGSPLPTNFSALKQIVGSEIIKAVVAGGGGVTERAEAETYLSNWNSPAQTAGVLGEYEQLMAGQLNGLRMQYESGSGLDDFDQRLRLNDKTLDVMKKHGYVSGGSGGTGGAAAGGGGSAPAAPSNKPTISNW